MLPSTDGLAVVRGKIVAHARVRDAPCIEEFPDPGKVQRRLHDAFGEDLKDGSEGKVCCPRDMLESEARFRLRFTPVGWVAGSPFDVEDLFKNEPQIHFSSPTIALVESK